MKRKPIKITVEMINAIFDDEKMTTQHDVATALWKIAIPDFSATYIKSISGYPSVHPETATYIMGKFMAFDREHHPKVMNGGLWFDQGFSSNDKVPRWEISMENCTIEYEQEELRKLAN